MPRTKNKAEPEDNDPFPHDESGFGELTMVEIYGVLLEGID